METALNRLNREVDAIEERQERRAAYQAIANKNKTPLKELLVWRMCSDPWPGGDMAAIDAWLDSESREQGFSDWVAAYHRL